jgi:hypothetical protein
VWCSLLTELVGQSVLSTVVCTCMLLLTQHFVHNTGNLHNMSSLHYNATQSSMAGSSNMFNTLNMQQTPPFVSTSRGGGVGGMREVAPPLGRLRSVHILILQAVLHKYVICHTTLCFGAYLHVDTVVLM